jgi:hypothetical protein
MIKRIYVETTISSYLAARPSRDLLQAARQQLSLLGGITSGKSTTYGHHKPYLTKRPPEISKRPKGG